MAEEEKGEGGGGEKVVLEEKIKQGITLLPAQRQTYEIHVTPPCA